MIVKLDLRKPFIKNLCKKVIFLDIETSLVNAKVFRTGNQYIQAKQLIDTTKILTVAYSSLYDLETKGKKSVKVLSNRFSKTFKKDPHDDRELLNKIWTVLDEAEVVVAHNAAFDKGWLHGRFLELGLPLPSKYHLSCTYRNLKPFNMTSKKLDELSKNLIGTAKVPTDFELWARCSIGDVDAFKEMEKYNVGDVYDTLYKVWKRTAAYNPSKSIDFTDYDSDDILCRVDGQYLVEAGIYINHSTGLSYYKYRNPRLNIYYRDAYNINSKRACQGFLRPLV